LEKLDLSYWDFWWVGPVDQAEDLCGGRLQTFLWEHHDASGERLVRVWTPPGWEPGRTAAGLGEITVGDADSLPNVYQTWQNFKFHGMSTYGTYGWFFLAFEVVLKEIS